MNLVNLKDYNLRFNTIDFIFEQYHDLYVPPLKHVVSIECPEIVKMLKEYPIMQQIIGELRADKINLDQELRKVKRERDILLNTLGKLTHD